MGFNNVPLDKVKGVLLDLDNCIYPHDECHILSLSYCYEYFKENISPNISRRGFDNLYKKSRKDVVIRLYPQGICRSRILYFQQMIENLGLFNKTCHAYYLEKIYLEKFLPSMKLDKEVIPFLEKCRSRNIDVCIITNYNTQYQLQKILHLKIDHLIGFVVTSEEIGKEKPHPDIFNACLEKLSLKTKEIIMVGDNQINDIKAAEDLGIKSYLVQAK